MQNKAIFMLARTKMLFFINLRHAYCTMENGKSQA